jgi:hypothetical protein
MYKFHFGFDFESILQLWHHQKFEWEEIFGGILIIFGFILLLIPFTLRDLYTTLKNQISPPSSTN